MRPVWSTVTVTGIVTVGVEDAGAATVIVPDSEVLPPITLSGLTRATVNCPFVEPDPLVTCNQATSTVAVHALAAPVKVTETVCAGVFPIKAPVAPALVAARCSVAGDTVTAPPGSAFWVMVRTWSATERVVLRSARATLANASTPNVVVPDRCSP